MTKRIETRFYAWPQTFLGRMVGGLLATALFISAFFFLIFFLVATGVLISVVAMRLLWRARQVRARSSQDVLAGEYSVETPVVERLDDPVAGNIEKR